MHSYSRAGVALALAVPLGALAAPPAPEVDALRREIDAMRADYEARLQALEQRVKAAEAGAAAAAGPASASASVGASAGASTGASTGAVASSGSGAGGFNPALSLILSGGYTRTSKDPENYSITGFARPPGAEIGPGARGFNLSETELGFSASIDPWLRGAATVAVAPDNSVSVEEAFFQTTSLGHGLSLKAGRFFSGIGYLNSQHAHAWDFADSPLAYQAMLGTQYGDDGLQLKWIPPIDQYVELGAELGRGRGFPGGDNSRNGAGMSALTLHTGGDVGASNSWRAGLSMLNTKATDQRLAMTDAAGATVNSAFSGRTRVWVVDGVWKWAPNGNATRTNFKLQGEYLRSTRTGDLAYDVDNAGTPGAFRSAQSGWYVQGVYQFMPRWRVGLRTERLNPGAPDFALAANDLVGRYKPRKNSLMIDYNPSEFSRVRLQFAQDRARRGFVDNQIFLQYQMSLGAHGAHSY